VLFPLLPATFLSAVVAYGLSVNAENRQTQDLIWEYIYPTQRAGRLIAPTFDDWMRAAEVVTSIEKKERWWRSKLAAPVNDILIALCARRIGALLLTYNRDDFRLIHRHTDFWLRILEG
jgi:predicted nucleic acid-binding protein